MREAIGDDSKQKYFENEEICSNQLLNLVNNELQNTGTDKQLQVEDGR